MVAMETRSTRESKKRRWKSSPSQSARVGLNFGPKSPPKKQRRVTSPKKSLTNSSQESDSFTIKSFYGKREKTHFPHSPSRRKAVEKVLDKISDENTDSDSSPTVSKIANKTTSHENKFKSPRSRFDFHSSDSGETETDGKPKSVLKQKNTHQNKKAAKKVPLEIIKSKQTPKAKASNEETKKVYSNSTGKLPSKSRLARIENDPRTPVSVGKRFFKSRSPASADKCFGSVIIKKGFDLKFVARRLSVSNTPKSEKKAKLTKKIIAKTKPVPRVPRVKDSNIKYWDQESVFFVDGSTSDDIVDNKQEQSICDEILDNEDFKKVTVSSLDKTLAKDNEDSAIDTANSNDLFSSLSDAHDNVKESQYDDSSVNEVEGGIDVGLRGAGSEDLFSVSGRTTPVEVTPSTSVRVSPSSTTGSNEDSSVVSGPVMTTPTGKKLFPIFTSSRNSTPANSSQLRKLRTSKSPVGSPLLKYVRSKDNLEQMMIDAGQKKFGVSQCDVCGMVYTLADPADETMHHKFHQSLLSALKFPGWKKERVVQQYRDTGSRVIMVSEDDPKYAVHKVEEINKIMGQELGFTEHSFALRPADKAFLYVSDEKKIEGCCVTQSITEGYRVLPDGSPTKSQNHPGQRPWCCSDQPVKASVGISRIWVYNQARKKGVATKLLDCVRQWSSYGIVIPKHRMAFSDPTPDGKVLATKYIGTPSFLVYKFR